jgi:histidinol-phosphate/aromatic aminotransferase/cobyric acid decarboxylase-like protein
MGASVKAPLPEPQIAPSPGAATASHYTVPRASAPLDLYLDGNEGAVPSLALYETLPARGAELLRRYPSAAALEAAFAARLGVGPEQVLVTAGGDESIDRACRAVLAPGRTLLLPEPTFEMIARYARLSGGEVVSVPWAPGAAWPVDAVLAAVTPATAMIALVSPNNPTGGVATVEDLHRVATAAPHALILVDLAYVEFADAGTAALCDAALALPNALVVRTLSKAWGLAGLRVGYAPGLWRSSAGCALRGPVYPVSGPPHSRSPPRPSTRARPRAPFVAQTVRRGARRAERDLARRGGRRSSQGNFVFAHVPEPVWLRDALSPASASPSAPSPASPARGACRITCPGDAGDLERLWSCLNATLRPQAMLFDLDGVLADVSALSRGHLRHGGVFGVTLSPEAQTSRRQKAAGDANNDWVLTQRLLTARGASTPLRGRHRALRGAVPGHETARPGCGRTRRCAVRPRALEAPRRPPAAGHRHRPPGAATRSGSSRASTFATCSTALVCMEDGPAQARPGARAPVRLGPPRRERRVDVRRHARRRPRRPPPGSCPSASRAGRSGPAPQPTLLAAGAARVLLTPLAFVELPWPASPRRAEIRAARKRRTSSAT